MTDQQSLERRYKLFEQVFQDINKKFMKPPSHVELEFDTSFQDFFDSYRKYICETDPILGKYKKFQYTGSNYDNLQIGTTYREFDMDILVRLPAQCNRTLNIITPGYVQIKLDILPTLDAEKTKIVKSWLDQNNFITPDNFRKWGESLMTRSLNKLDNHVLKGSKGEYKLKMKKSGPAFTMNVQKINSALQFDVDIVFCLVFEQWPASFHKINNNVTVNEWLAVPKTPNSLVNQGYKDWRYSFPQAEKYKLGNYMNLKNTIRMMKKLRDTNNMNYLASYYIKTLFLWEVDKQEPQFWQKNLGYLFVKMVGELYKAVENKRLDFYWNKEVNLLAGLSVNQLENCKITLKRLLEQIETFAEAKTPDAIRKILLTENEKKLA
ncbi:cyclic GMP-AMP synthase-like receptor [Arctopsyche grandis]|uniref:cyclic GMP-AMP synthase-like receptor n=1 Tax=Arctopsyche grandis TaxID=121162 RepID=UPI00406D929C